MEEGKRESRFKTWESGYMSGLFSVMERGFGLSVLHSVFEAILDVQMGSQMLESGALERALAYKGLTGHAEGGAEM